FIEETAMQCGYCIPGFIMSSVALLNRVPTPDSGQIREALSENMCRCGAYQRIERAVLRASGQRQ
ncbi:MAG: 2Fe-2S iron-sulfur cluster-binding protein, partial [Anaerolineaceae bacterium]